MKLLKEIISSAVLLQRTLFWRDSILPEWFINDRAPSVSAWQICFRFERNYPKSRKGSFVWKTSLSMSHLSPSVSIENESFSRVTRFPMWTFAKEMEPFICSLRKHALENCVFPRMDLYRRDLQFRNRKEQILKSGIFPEANLAQFIATILGSRFAWGWRSHSLAPLRRFCVYFENVLNTKRDPCSTIKHKSSTISWVPFHSYLKLEGGGRSFICLLECRDNGEHIKRTKYNTITQALSSFRTQNLK